MPPASRRLDHWPSVVGHIASLMDLDASAKSTRALVRKRGVRSAADLLHLALLYGPGGLSLRSVVNFATEAGIADLGEVALLDRLRNAGDFLAEVLARLLSHSRGDPPTDGRLQLNLVDGSTVSVAARKGSDWRLRARYEPARGGGTDLVITEATTAEALCCVAVRPGDALMQDRGYARVRNFAHAHAQGADFITRIGWHSVNLFDLAGQRFDLMAALPENGPALVVEHAVRIGAATTAVTAHLIIARKPPEATERRHRKLHRKASRKGHKTDPRTLRSAGFMMLLTSLSPASATAEEVVKLYRMRWHVELAFKRLKSLGGFAALRADDRRLARTWLLAHLIAAVLIETSLGEGLDSPLRPRLRHRHADAVCGGIGNAPTGACNRRYSLARANARRRPSAAPREDGLPSRRENARARQARRELPYPSAYGAEPSPCLCSGGERRCQVELRQPACVGVERGRHVRQIRHLVTETVVQRCLGLCRQP
jgi:hypothetical protein